MKLYCKVLALLLGFGLVLLLYLFVGNADGLPGKGWPGEASRSPSGLGKAAVAAAAPPPPPHPFAHFRPTAAPLAEKQPRMPEKQERQTKIAEFRNRPAKQRYFQDKLSKDWMHLAVVACGERLEETLTMLKSAILFSNSNLKFHIFSEDSLKPQFENALNGWPHSHTSRFQYHIYPITFSVGNAQEWKKLFKPCAAQRLFLPVILKDVDSLVYVDTDTLFLRPVDDIWSFLKQFNSTQLAAMAPEHEIPKIGWYSRFARHPYYGVTGVNSGVMLMNLTRIRSTLFKNSLIPNRLRWEEMLYPLYQKYKNYITWGDQDLLNIIFHYNPDCLYIFPCQWNYRPDHCMYGSNCKGAEEEGVSILHGNRGVYHDDKQPAFKAVYEAIHDLSFWTLYTLYVVGFHKSS
ncbi:glucoside xylosyltransferase 2 isoform X2 [Latimeria chalumnae]|uniref:glucoside xylosyltransferase 2 isoform X2 n=1 Tax=Latimeria chalumnae TaxID=7897 RepID=UPI00313E6B76